MSEIKGQLLGLVLVLAIFGVVGTAMVEIFRTTTNDLKTRVEETDEWDGSSASGSIITGLKFDVADRLDA
jgi:hypothetical protein